MKRRKLSMRKIKEILRLHYEHKISNRNIGKACKISPTTVGEYIDRAREMNIDFNKILELDDKSLYSLLYPEKEIEESKTKQMPDMNYLHEELKKKGVTIQLLWEEYRSHIPEGYSRTQFFYLYKEWSKRLHPTLRITHKAGEKMFVDFSGDKPYYIDSITGEIIYTELFVSVLGASSYTFATALRSQGLEDWIRGHIKAFEYFGGCPEIVVPDNLKSGVKRACIYDPEINPLYAEMAEHYNLAIIPARAYKPKDKAKVENGVLNSQRRILAVIRNKSFFSLSELNQGIQEALSKLNKREMQLVKKSREQLFHEIEKPALKRLPQNRFKIYNFKKAKVHIDYHIELDGNYYSVPYKYIHKYVEVKYNDLMINIYYENKRLASHYRSYKRGEFVTDDSHRPASHTKYLEWTPARIKHWGKSMGLNTEALMGEIMSSRRHVEQGYRSCLGILRLSKKYSPKRLDNACKRALSIGAINYRSIKSILEKGLDKEAIIESKREPTIIEHENIRGGRYYQEVTHD
jgi:transposase